MLSKEELDKALEMHTMSSFQKDFIKQIHHFNQDGGYFKWIQNYWVDKYKDVVTEVEFDDELCKLISDGYVISTTKKEIFNYKWVTSTYLTIDYEKISDPKLELIFHLKKLKDYIDNLNTSDNKKNSLYWQISKFFNEARFTTNELD